MAAPRIRSIQFPFRKGDLAFPAPATDTEVIFASVVQIITTNKGERIMRPDFGCNAFTFVFEPDTEEFRLDVEREVRQSLSKWEKRVRVESVDVSSDEITEPGQVLIDIVYTIVSTGEVQTVSIAGGV
jgi:phage baseplate assembly protein W